MLLSRWFRRCDRPAPARRFRPTVMLLEDRTVPSRFPSPGPATHLQVIVPESVQAGKTFDVVVEALDASNHVATGFTDQISLSSSDKTATGTATHGSALTALPLSYTFSPSDHGIHKFQVNLTTTGSQSLSAADTTNTSVTGGSASTNVTPAPVPTTLVVETPEQAAVGVPTHVEVEVLDQSGHVMRNFTGTVTLTSSDTSATASPNHHTTPASVPITYTFTPADHGEHTFVVTFNEAAANTGTATTVTASTPVGNSTLTGSGTVTVYPANVATHFGVFAFPVALSGAATPVVVVALNAANQVVTGYTGTVNFSSSTDPTATVSATHNGAASPLSSFTYTFTTGTGGDNGKHTFWVTFDKTGKQTLSVTDSANSLNGSADFYVLAALPFGKHHG